MLLRVPFKIISKFLILACLFLYYSMPSIGQAGISTQAFDKHLPFLPQYLTPQTYTTINPARLLNTTAGSNPIIKTTTTTTSCNTSVFFMHLSETGKKITVKEVQTFPNGNFMIAGNVILSNGEEEGLIFTLSNAGVLIAQQQLRINNKPVTLYACKVMVDGKMIVAGVLHDITDKVMVSLLSNTLNPVWLKTFDMPSVTTKVVADYTENGQVSFAAQVSNSIVYSVLNADGSQAWCRQISPSGLDELAGIGHTDYGEMLLLSNCTRSAKKVAEALRFTQANGATLSTHTIGNGTDEYQFGKVTSYSNRVIFSGIVKNNLSQYKLVRDIAFNSATVETEHTYTIPVAVDFNSSSVMDNAGDALGYCFSAIGKMVFIRHFAYYQTSPEYTRQYTVPTGASISSATRSLIDGGYLFSLNTTDSSEILLVKTDSIGSLPGCGYQDITNNYTETINAQNTLSGANTSSIATVAATGTLTTAATTLNVSTDCNQVFCPPPPPDDTCLSSYFKILRSNSHIDAFGPCYLMANNKQIAFTTRNNRIWGTNAVTTYGIKSFNERGDFIKGVDVYLNNISAPVLSRKIDDTHIMLILYSVTNGQPCYTFTLIDDDLQILWSKTIKTFSGYNFTSGLLMGDLTSDSEGNFYFVGNNLGFNETRKVLAYKMDASGNPLWLKIYDVSGNLFLICSATTTNSSLVVVVEGNPTAASLRLDKVTGQLQNAYTFDAGTDGSTYNRFLKFENDRIYYGGNYHSEFLMGLFDTTGKPVKLQKINRSESIIRAGAVKNGNFYGVYEYYTGTEFKNTLFKTDSTLAIQYSHDFDNTRYGFPSGIGISDQGNIYVGGNYFHGGVNGSYADPFIKKFDANGYLGTCNVANLLPAVTDVLGNVQVPACNPFTNSFTPISATVTFVPDTAGQRISELLCSSTPLCTSLDITGPDTICTLNQPYTYNILRNTGCTLMPIWIYDTAFATLQNNTGNTTDFIFKKTGNTWLKAKLNAGCSSFYDSIQVQIQNVPQNFSLGRDTLMCPGSSILLHAGPGFTTYEWQDGSADSVFNATQPGRYYVKVTNLCGNIYADTIDISPAALPALYIGNDSTVCYGDTLHLTAQSGFINYQWHAVSTITGTGAQVYIIPLQNDTITLKAISFNGCIAYDTLKIISIKARPVYLGKDTGFCVTGSVTLFAGSGYSQYTWSNGFNGTSVVVQQPGIYWVKVKDINGCFASDSINVKAFSLPKPDLGKDFNICKGEQQTLDPGIFNKYAWSDGSASRLLTVSVAGIYWVTVTDINNCKGVDYVLLKNVFAVPANFLKAADSICQYESLTITSPSNFNSYQWSTGAATASISVDNPGSYFLTVKDNNGCSGKDTINIIQKNCFSGVFIPNSFTPNKDQRNDIFRARVYGTVISFKLEVFNRYGELVFATKDPQQGWDGNYKGELQPMSSFTWQCSYQIAGGALTYKKGFVTLLR